MKVAALPENEKERVRELESYRILDTMPEPDFDDITRIAAQICGTPISLISLVDKDRQWFKSKVGLSATETSRDVAFCSHAILQNDVLIVPDSLKDERFQDNPLVSDEPHVRFYVGAPLFTSTGHALGTLCVIDKEPHELNEQQIESLRALARQVIRLFELRKEKTRLDEVTRAKSAFMANISHEIRTPINGVIGMSNLLLGSVHESVHVEQLKIIRSCGNALLNLVNDILDFSKLEAEKMEFEQKPFLLHEMVEDVLKVLRVQAAEKNLILAYRHSSSVPACIKGDAYRLRQILTNLVSNAIKFTDQGSVQIYIDVKTNAEGKLKIQFSIMDTGVGIPEDQRGKLFQPFSQMDDSTTRKHGGTGLGLTISKSLCEKMGGEIWVESLLGKGSTFHFTILTEEASAPSFCDASSNTMDAIDSEMGKKHPLKILIAEDNKINQLVAVGVLGKLGYLADVAVSGKEVLNALKNKTYDLILMDCHMPEMDGFETTRKIHELLPGDKRPYIAALTASSLQQDIEHCFSIGMDGFLSKPLMVNELIKVLQNCGKDRFAQSFDKKAFLQNIGSNEELVSFVSSFLNLVPCMVIQIEAAISSQQPEALEIAAQALKGSTSTFYAQPVRLLAWKLEQIGHGKICSKMANKVLDELKIELRRLMDDLAALADERKCG